MNTFDTLTTALLTGAIVFLWGSVVGIGGYVDAGVLATVACGVAHVLVTHANKHRRK